MHLSASPRLTRSARRSTALRSVAALTAVTALVTAGCGQNDPPAEPPGTITTAAPNLDNRVGEVRGFLDKAMLENDPAKLVELAAGPARAFAQFNEALNKIGDYKARTGGDTPTTSTDVDGVTGLRRGDDNRIVVTGEVSGKDDDGEETTLTDIELVEEGGGLKLYNFRLSTTGMKANEMVVTSEDSASNSDVDAKMLFAACLPPGTIDKDEPALQLVLSYSAAGSKAVRLTDGEVKPPAATKIAAEDGWSDTARPKATSYGSVVFLGAAFDGATATVEFTDEDDGKVPALVLSVPEFPDARACRTAVKGGSTGTTRGSGTTRRSGTTRPSGTTRTSRPATTTTAASPIVG